MPEWIAPIIILAVVGLIFLATAFRKKRVQKFTDPYCIAFMELCDHILQGRDYSPGVKYQNIGKDKAQMLPFEEQTELIKELFMTKPDEYSLERFRKMHELRTSAQEHLMAFSLISNKYNGVLNRLFNLAEVLLIAMSDVNKLETKDQLLDLNFVLLNQEKLRVETMPAIMSEEGKKGINIRDK
ncbi:MAG: hypothetical protein Q4C01_07780 [Clostridia bacterium]|nr:hypothetical protein [Clostridia bacterium]